MATGDRKDPFRGFNFKLEIDGVSRNGFRECTGLDAKTAPVDYREGDHKGNVVSKLTGLNTYSNITLKWGSTDDHSLWDWRKTVIDGKTQRKNGSIVLMDEAGEEKTRWNFVAGWAAEWTGPSFNATANEVAIETLVIVHEGATKA
jgi:phage tail-like protein